MEENIVEENKEDCKTCGPTKYNGLKKSEPVVILVDDNGVEKEINWREVAFAEMYSKIVIENVEGVEVKSVE